MSRNRRAATRPSSRRRLYAAAAAIVAFGGLIGVTQISRAGENSPAAAVCDAPPAAGASASPGSGRKAATDPEVGTYTDSNGVTQHKGDGQLAEGERPQAPDAKDCENKTTAGGQKNGLAILADSCEDSRLDAHDGFQVGNRCVSTEFGEVGTADKNPTLLITESPRSVEAGKPFRLRISTRNLVRDRFLAAGKGGYYVESSILTGDGLVRGHFHTACRMLSDTRNAVDPAPAPAFFVATEDGRGSGRPDVVTIEVPGLPEAGTAQCAAWAGDGSHRVPMMQRANQTPAFDVVRVQVRKGAEQPPAEEPQPTQPADPQPTQPADPNPPADNPPADDPPPNGNDNGGNDNGGNDIGQPAPVKTTAAPVKTTAAPSVKTTIVPAKPAGSSTPKPTRTTAPASDDEDDAPAPAKTQPAATNEDEPEPAATTKAAKPKRSATSAPAAVSNEDDGRPDPDTDEPPAQNYNVEATDGEGGGKLALTGVSTITAVLGGAVLVLGGFVLIGAMRRRRVDDGL